MFERGTREAEEQETPLGESTSFTLFTPCSLLSKVAIRIHPVRLRLSRFFILFAYKSKLLTL